MWAGISAESGLGTFRDSGGLWENFRIEDVATPEAWHANPALVLDFYNLRRKVNNEAQPNEAHRILADLEKHFDIDIVTQNIDDLHERAGSKNVLHLHGEIMKARSTTKENLIYNLEHWEIKEGDLCEKGSQLRPHIVWFGEAVPMMDAAIDIVASADILVIVGTSMVVYPAASLVHYAPENAPVYCIDPTIPPLPNRKIPVVSIQKGGSEGLAELQKVIDALI
jgi:NAD-dependent deacetylase